MKPVRLIDCISNWASLRVNDVTDYRYVGMCQQDNSYSALIKFQFEQKFAYFGYDNFILVTSSILRFMPSNFFLK